MGESPQSKTWQTPSPLAPSPELGRGEFNAALIPDPCPEMGEGENLTGMVGIAQTGRPKRMNTSVHSHVCGNINSQAKTLGIERPILRNGHAIANLNTLLHSHQSAPAPAHLQPPATHLPIVHLYYLKIATFHPLVMNLGISRQVHIFTHWVKI